MKARATLQQARENRFRTDPSQPMPGAPSFIGVKAFDAWDLQDLADHIDWTPFFASWELIGRYPLILEDETVGQAARDLFQDAQAMLKRIVEEKWFTAKGVVGFWPARAVGDDIAVFSDETRSEEIARFHTLRQQIKKSNGKPNLALSDFIADDGDDYIGAFAVTAGHGELEIAKRFKDAGDDYSSILATALADRLAEAFAECLHQEVARRSCGATRRKRGQLSERRADRRALSGHPTGLRLPRVQPDHTEKAHPLRVCSNAPENVGHRALTESFAMTAPGAQCERHLLRHTRTARYFTVGQASTAIRSRTTPAARA